MFINTDPDVRDSVKQFVATQAPLFDGIQEFSHTHMQLYQEFVTLLDRHVTDFLRLAEVSQHEFEEALVQLPPEASGSAELRVFFKRLDFMEFAQHMHQVARGAACNGL